MSRYKSMSLSRAEEETLRELGWRGSFSLRPRKAKRPRSVRRRNVLPCADEPEVTDLLLDLEACR